MSSHFIHRQELEIVISDKSRARAAQDRISSLNQSNWLPVLAKTLDELYGPEEWVRLDRLELDLGSLSTYSDTVLERKLRETLIVSLKKAERENRILPVKPFGSNGEILAGDPKRKEVDPVLYYLKTGTMLWSARGAKEVFAQLRRQILNAANFDIFAPVIKDHGFAALDRMIRTLQPEDVLTLLNKLIDQPDSKWKDWYERLLNYVKDIVESQNQPFQNSIVQKTCLQESLKILIRGTGKSLSNKKRFQNDLLIRWMKLVVKKFGIELKKIGEIEKNLLRETLISQGVSKHSISKLFESEFESDSEMLLKDLDAARIIEINEILCTNAGITLIWPYLPAFFKSQNWVREKKFVSTQHIHQAIQCLHYMATGRELEDETEAPVYKLLCGLNYYDLVGLDEALPETVKNEANELLLNVIQNWKVLKGTSLDGLREGWLQRSGRLRSEQNGFLIDMEPSAIDILLDKVTWPISTILLPWNPKIIHVKWK